MILSLAVRFKKPIALMLYCVFYSQMLLAMKAYDTGLTIDRSAARIVAAAMPFSYHPDFKSEETSRIAVTAAKKNFGGGPGQPENRSNPQSTDNDLVDLFTGDFSYNIPLLDVGGYPVTIGYRSGRGMDEEASWVGLGWNINPGSITRDMRGLPDDFSGGTDTVKKVANIKPNVSIGANIGGDAEVVGLPILSIGGSLGVFHTTYTGWGMELGLNASLNAGAKSGGPLSGGLSITDNSQSGVTINPSLSARLGTYAATENGSAAFGAQMSAPYNSRTGLKDIHLGLTSTIERSTEDQKRQPVWSTETAGISFAWNTYTPTITLPMTNYNFSLTGKIGTTWFSFHPNVFLSGYYGREYIAAADTALSLPAFGYLNYQKIANNYAALSDFNREKEIPYREKPAVPHIAVPAYTYDVFSISGASTGGIFRAYRGDIGFVADHLMRNKTISGAASIDFGAGNLAHGGVDINANYSITQTGPWVTENKLKNSIAFQQNRGLYEAVYFKNPNEKAVNSAAFYKAMGGDDVLAATLDQAGNSSPSIIASNILNRYDHKKKVGADTLTASSAIRPERDKRTQVITYLTAAEAALTGLDKTIDNYTVNQFGHYCENSTIDESAGKGTGLQGSYFWNESMSGLPKYVRNDTLLYFNWGGGSPVWHDDDGVKVLVDRTLSGDHFSARWEGRLKAPVSGVYALGTYSDDGVRMWINDSMVINDWTVHGNKLDTCRLNFVGGKMYKIKVEYFEKGGKALCKLGWRRPDVPLVPFNNKDTIAKQFLYPPVYNDTTVVNPILSREDRVNTFRKATHLSEIDVLNKDGRRYVYGIPVYNIVQKEVSFAVNKGGANQNSGLTSYSDQDNSTRNNEGKDGYYSRQEIPAFASSFLLTGVVSPNYVDLTGDGISDDDLGDAVRIDYSKTSGIKNPYGWRAPYIADSAGYDEGFRSYSRDDKAHYIYGTKELWYLHSIESKSMVANFTLQPRADLLEADERGHKANTGKAMCLKQIDLYAKSDFLLHGSAATPIKTVHFEYSYELCRGVNYPANDSGKLTLKKIWFTYNGNEKSPRNPYVFHYHTNSPRYKVNSSDKWGTYKDNTQNPGSVAGNLLTNAEYPYSLQDSAMAADNAAAWSLDSMLLPTGARMKINYESDDYAFVQNRRATQMLKIAGFGTNTTGSYTSNLYDGSKDHLYVYIKVPRAVHSNSDLYARYLDGIGKIYFKIYVQMPTDDFGSGFDYVPGYADPDVSAAQWYGTVNDSVIWVKVKGVNKTGDADGNYSPLAQTVINYLRLNLPSKAYPGSEVRDDIDLSDAIKIVASLGGNISGLIKGFTNTARSNGWGNLIDPNRSYVRLDCPNLKKYGGGGRVRSILTYDNWNAMTGKRETVYGLTYDYTTVRTVNGKNEVVSSGVAAWEPAIGSEENPFHLPIDYVDRVSLLAPAATLYTEEPLGEAFFPGPSVGYSKVRIRSIHTTGTRSASGFTESQFYTSYDYPTTWDWSLLDNDTKKRYKPLLNNFLRINAMNYLTLSQGFKVELNDMNGKPKSESVFSERDLTNPIQYSAYYFKTDDQSVEARHLNSTVMAIDPYGNIDTAATVGKDVELMTDMRDQTSTSIGGNVNINADMFLAGIWPVILPSLLNLYQKETNQYRSVAISKVIQRYGILDSVVHVDRGSKVTSKNMLYDAETGEPILVRTQNEFNDSVFQFHYPAYWAYPGTGPAYQNIGALADHLTINAGKITAGLTQPDSTFLFSGDELLVYSKLSIDTEGCNMKFASFPDAFKVWVVDANEVKGGQKQLYLVNEAGIPFSGNDVSLKVVRSGHRNLHAGVGDLSCLSNPLRRDGSGIYHLSIDSNSRVVTAAAHELQEYWKVADKHKSDAVTNCVYSAADSAAAAAEACGCMKPLFSYLIASHKLLQPKVFFLQKTVRSLVESANAAGYPINLASCPLLSANADLPFYTLKFNKASGIYQAMVGHLVIDLNSRSGNGIDLYQLTNSSCDAGGRPIFQQPGLTIPKPDTITKIIYPYSTVNLFSAGPACPDQPDSLTVVDSISDHLMVENSLDVDTGERNAVAILRFNRPERQIPIGATLLSADLILKADQRGHLPPKWPNASSVYPVDTLGLSLVAPAGWFPYQPLDTMLYQAYYTQWFAGVQKTDSFRNDTLNVLSWLQDYIDLKYGSSQFVLTQGSGRMHSHRYDSLMVANHEVPSYLTTGYSNYYSTFYNLRYSDSTKWPGIRVRYLTPQPFADTLGAALTYNSTISCNTVVGRICYSAITDTVVNPYQYGILGNFRDQRRYAYYGNRKENDPASQTNIRQDGAIRGFLPFWQLQGHKWLPAYDTSRWVWSMNSTLFDKKGSELESVDAIGRYTAGLFGYGQTKPVAIALDSRYQEIAFDGFEDYAYEVSTCDSVCPESRAFDFSPYQSNMTQNQAHTGLYSLRVGKDSLITIVSGIQSASANTDAQLKDSSNADACLGTRWNGIRATSNIILPPFKPLAGKKMFLSAWVKEDNTCNCQSYVRDHIQLSYSRPSGNSSVTFSPSGNLIEGWQRYEAIFDIPSDATGLTLLLKASDSSTTYFDDIRIQPFNSQMKTFVYSPLDLKLMAELDENNYATFYEYDDNGILVRLKKETERGIQTVRETRNALYKEQ